MNLNTTNLILKIRHLEKTWKLISSIIIRGLRSKRLLNFMVIMNHLKFLRIVHFIKITSNLLGLNWLLKNWSFFSWRWSLFWGLYMYNHRGNNFALFSWSILRLRWKIMNLNIRLRRLKCFFLKYLSILFTSYALIITLNT